MDNAAKALIMAGAILIAVALVGLGVYLFSSASSTVTDATGNIDATKVQTQNAKFEQYAGDDVKGPEVKTLIRAVGACNANEIFPQPITITGVVNGTTADIANGIEDRNYYDIDMTNYDATTGQLLEITITAS